ncbi:MULTISPECIES: HEAT repeat domain-containing protein [unclassified Methanoregula]|uniref:HEAT repeat domain-containing protein n=1 Tax=unclassified Methanoregula TaxID=2649730 RepID=UPI0009C6B237|nr:MULTISPECIES: HEAT repeat domain-containing protein [unclassified Methanoregula]OPX62495.1 MAG: PBS lyase HEAT-like repeat protein [Methanoregula sp. PtaB.Bin085]OPY31594.1 MAG: PBS lyase HEAT-like repeat protein [Methanoregula sp. PtaU1.Bin006]
MDDADDNTPDNRLTDQPDNHSARNSARLEHFIAMLSDDDEVSRWKAAEALGRIGDPAAVDELIGALWDDNANVRMKAAWALGQIGDRRAYAPLKRLYRMETERTKEIIEEALERIRRGIAGGER